MATTNHAQRAALEMQSEVLRVRERCLLDLAQSRHCPNRAGAEAELGKVREQLVATYAQLRMEQPSGFAGPRYPRL